MPENPSRQAGETSVVPVFPVAATGKTGTTIEISVAALDFVHTFTKKTRRAAAATDEKAVTLRDVRTALLSAGIRAFVLLMTRHLDTFTLFLRTGLALPGGGYALVPRLERELVSRRALLSAETFHTTVSVAQCLPGVFSLNLGAGLGYRLGGRWGSVAAVAGLLVPAFAVMWLLAMWLASGARPDGWLRGLRPAVIALVALAAVSQWRGAGITPATLFLPLAAMLLVWLLGVSPFLIVVTVALIAYLYAKYVKPLE